MDTDSNQIRLGVIGIVALSLFLALFGRLWFLQGIERQEFEAASVSNRLRVLHTEGPRGRIFDINGRVLVDNRTQIVVALDREPLREAVSGLDENDPDDAAEIRAELAAGFSDMAIALSSYGIPTSEEDIWESYIDKRYAPQESVPIADDVPVEVEQYFAERQSELPGVVVERRTVRVYPYGRLAAHVIGYVGEVNDQELLERGVPVPGSDEEPSSTTTVPDETSKPYLPGDSIGKTGVESAYEEALRGTPGQRTIEVNAQGELLDVVSEQAPERGDDVWLTIDLDLQKKAEDALAARVESLRGNVDKDGRPTDAPQGSVVVTDPMTGEVRAMASYPSYDPAELVNGISSGLWDYFQSPESGYPLNNWAMQGTYAPGSAFKPITAMAGMHTGFLHPGHESYPDSGSYELQNCESDKCEFQNAGRVAHGTVDIPRSLTVSSDVFYYWVAEGLWLNRNTYGETAIADSAESFGMGSKTGIDLPGENPGRIPTPERRREAYAANPDVFVTDKWFTGDNLNTGIGQGDVLSTPLQLANVYSTIANGGAVMRPHVVFRTSRSLDATKPPGQEGNYEVTGTIEPEELSRVEFTPEQHQKIVSGLVGVTQDGSGTASEPWQNNPTAWPMAGKTGTAEVSGKADTSVFAGWGPVAEGLTPQYTVAVIIPESGFGADVAAPLAFEILAPASRGELAPVCPAREPERSECESKQARALERAQRDLLEAAAAEQAEGANG